jgi:poly-gamma-glutamate capsule biosynthesis protein CapA/YwtB (metallophosphatase superfamily)
MKKHHVRTFIHIPVFFVLAMAPLRAFSQQQDVTVIVAGDVMAPKRVKDVAFRNGVAEQSYFGTLLEKIRPIVSHADLAFANLETPVSRSELVRPVPFVFNAPQELLKGLKWIGFQVLSVANNHALDQRLQGLSETISSIESEGLIPVGAGRDRETSLAGHVTDVRGLRIGILAFTALVNGGTKIARASDSPYLNLSERTQELFAAVDAMKSRSDVVLLSIHWGVEYETEPRKWQVKLAEELHARGVDVIIGHHPHVLQPIKWYTAKNGRKQLTIYSLGNLIANQGATYMHAKDKLMEGRSRDSVLAELHLSSRGVEAFRVHPLWVDNWRGIEEGVRTVRITDEIRNLDNEIKRMSPSPQRSFYLERRKLLADLYDYIYKTLKLK